jgi:hypothetical protein
MMDLLFQPLSDEERSRQYQGLKEEIAKKRTPKSISVSWNPDEGESGYFSEVECVGGIMEYLPESETCEFILFIYFWDFV